MARRVLMVDDSKTTRDMVTFTLRRAGYEVIEATDGRNALAVLGTGRVDCVITDLNMPVMDGLDLIRNLRSSANHRTVPILMLTTDSDEAKKAAGKTAGANGWLNKPFHPTNLVRTVTGLVPLDMAAPSPGMPSPGMPSPGIPSPGMPNGAAATATAATASR